MLQDMSISASSLAKNFDSTIALLAEILMLPRWQESEFERLKSTFLTVINPGKGDTSSIKNLHN